jgi:hypothetical protein
MSCRFTIGRHKHFDVPVFDDSVSRLLIMAGCRSVNGTSVVRGTRQFPLGQNVMLPGDCLMCSGLVRYIVLLIPTLGFIGTATGLGPTLSRLRLHYGGAGGKCDAGGRYAHRD